MAIRKIIEIDEEKCDGCGECVPSCVEGALAIVDGKARLVRDSLCDGIGNCLGECPQDAIRVIEREAEAFVDPHAEAPAQHSACPSARVLSMPAGAGLPAEQGGSALRQWPVQLALVPPFAPYLAGADILITADCVPFAYGNYHRDFLDGRAVLVGCPKLDNLRAYMEKMTEIFRTAAPRSVTVLNMEVPCCFGIAQAARMAMEAAGRDTPVRVVTIGVDGSVKSDSLLEATSGRG